MTTFEHPICFNKEEVETVCQAMNRYRNELKALYEKPDSPHWDCHVRWFDKILPKLSANEEMVLTELDYGRFTYALSSYSKMLEDKLDECHEGKSPLDNPIDIENLITQMYLIEDIRRRLIDNARMNSTSSFCWPQER